MEATTDPKLNRWGKVSSPPLTDEQKERGTVLFGEGKNVAEVARLLDCTYKRAQSLKLDRDRSQRIHLLRLTDALPTAMNALVAGQKSMLTVLEELNQRVTTIEGELKKASKALERRKLELHKERTQRRDARKELAALKRLLHSKTGIDWDAYGQGLD